MTNFARFAVIPAALSAAGAAVIGFSQGAWLALLSVERGGIERNAIFKPHPDAYALIESTLNVPPADVLFISSNPWDACGAKSFGLKVAWIERVTPETMALACVESDVLPPLTMFKAIRTQMDELGYAPDHRIHALSELPALVSRA